MDRSKRNLRREAAKAFIASLDQLENVLVSDAVEASASLSRALDGGFPSHPQASPTPIEPYDLDRAAAEIEAFFQSQSKEQSAES